MINPAAGKGGDVTESMSRMEAEVFQPHRYSAVLPYSFEILGSARRE